MHFLLRSLLIIALVPFTLTAAIETWTSLDGKKMEAEFLGLKGDYVAFKTPAGDRMLYPYAKLTKADRARVDAFLLETPAAPPNDENLSDTTKIASALSGKLVSMQGASFAPVSSEQLSATKVYAVYFSAIWCPPCRGFTPELVKGYSEIKSVHPEFELIFVSSDEDEKSMKRYMTEYGMPWTALRYGLTKRGHIFSAYKATGIPNLVFIDGDGKVLSKSYDDEGNYLGPRKVLKDIRRHFNM
jgi:thiol-disulfide isomerase/thioredoxin